MRGDNIETLSIAATTERVEESSQDVSTTSEKASTDDSSIVEAMLKAPSGYLLDDTGVYCVSSDGKGRQKIASPIWVTAVTEDKLDKSVGVVISWVDLRGNTREKAFSMDVLYETGAEFIKYLGRSGVRVVPSQASHLKKYLIGFVDDLPFIGSVSKLGWLDANYERLVYVLPQQVIEDKSHKQKIIFQPEQHAFTTDSIYSAGDYFDWSNNVANLCVGNPMLIFALCVGYSGLLLHFTGVETGGFNIFGRSSGGKTTLLQVAASVMGNGSAPGGDPTKSFVQTWNTTGNALEALAAASNDGVLLLDEIHTCNDNDFGRVVYNLSGGRGKSRLGHDADIKKSRAWRVMILSTGEKSAREKILESAKRVHSGQLLRLIDVPADENIILNSGRYEPAEYCDLIKKNCSEYFGTAGPAFIQSFIFEYESFYSAKREINKRFDSVYQSLKLPNMEREQERALKKFALVATAGCLASELGGLPMKSDAVIDAVKYVVNLWLSDSANLPSRIKSAIKLREFIHRNQSRFQLSGTTNDLPPNNLVGYLHSGTANGQTQRMYLFTDDGFKEACNGDNPSNVANDLKELGLLHINDNTRTKAKHNVAIGGSQKGMRFYTVLSSILEFDEFEKS